MRVRSLLEDLIQYLFTYHWILAILTIVLIFIALPFLLPLYGLTFLFCFLGVIERKILKLDERYPENLSISPFKVDLKGKECRAIISDSERKIRHLESFGFTKLGTLHINVTSFRVKHQENTEVAKYAEKEFQKDLGKVIEGSEKFDEIAWKKEEYLDKNVDKNVYEKSSAIKSVKYFTRANPFETTNKVKKLEKAYKILRIIEIPIILLGFIGLIIVLINGIIALNSKEYKGLIISSCIFLGLGLIYLGLFISEEILCKVSRKELGIESKERKKIEISLVPSFVYSIIGFFEGIFYAIYDGISFIIKKIKNKKKKVKQVKNYQKNKESKVHSDNNVFLAILKVLKYIILSPYYLIKYIIGLIQKLFSKIKINESVLKIGGITLLVCFVIFGVFPTVLDVINYPLNIKNIEDEGVSIDEEVCLWSTVQYEGEYNGCHYEAAYIKCSKHDEKEYLYDERIDLTSDVYLNYSGHDFDENNICSKCHFEIPYKYFVGFTEIYNDIQEYIDENIEYVMHDDYVEVIGIKQICDRRKFYKLYIPSYINNLPVTNVEFYYYNGNIIEKNEDDLEKLDIHYFAPANYNCYVSLPSIRVGELHFYGDIKVIDTNLEIPNEDGSISKVNNGAIDAETICIYNQVETIKSNTFSTNHATNGYMSLKILGGVTNIEEKAFDKFKLKTVTLTKDCLNVAVDAFNYDEIVDFYVEEDNPNYYSSDGILFSKDKKKIIVYPKGKKREVYQVPSDVERINIDVFGANFPNFYLSNLPIIDYGENLRYDFYMMFLYLNEDVKSFNFRQLMECREYYGANEDNSWIIDGYIDISLNSGKDINWEISSSQNSSLPIKKVTSNFYQNMSRTFLRIKENANTIRHIDFSELYELYLEGYDTVTRK